MLACIYTRAANIVFGHQRTCPSTWPWYPAGTCLDPCVTVRAVGAAYILYGGTEEEDSRAQIAKLEEAFRRPSPRPAVRSEPNRLRKETASGMALVHALTQLGSGEYHQTPGTMTFRG